ncbi:GNAT family N-acetyltransferase [Paraburkholderia sp. DHOC27]|uniref:GNAT family N-acetyltransferase n=1 Tax=Paraburkholderia sp. DHOC27 TaxID=2303330 RepID=UPI000E3EC71E|nr:GNAT family N-acetyltransferase [Paraburkholderia sp. DHOC27]RFU45158.1 N-acetyltransferase [Paraburkholderia sp. DHOC27]
MPNLADNLGIATDLLLHAETGKVERRDDYIVVRTPDSPDYFFGNMLFLQARPTTDDLQRLEIDFARWVGTPPLIAHRAFEWPETAEVTVELDGFIERGYDATVCQVLVARDSEIRPVATNAAVEVRALATQTDWDDWNRMQLAVMPDPADPTTQRYMAHKQRAYRALITRGLGQWWGAFIDGEQVGSLGLFFLGGMGRFQSVITAEQHRNRGICKTLLSEVIRRTEGRAKQLVMVADESYHAGRIYESLGFVQHGRVASLCREPR